METTRMIYNGTLGNLQMQSEKLSNIPVHITNSDYSLTFLFYPIPCIINPASHFSLIIHTSLTDVYQ